MILDPRSGMPIRSYRKGNEDVRWLADLLKTEGLSVPPETPLTRSFEAASHLPDTPPGPRPPSDLAWALGVEQLARILRAASKHPAFRGICRLLPHLTAIFANPIQTVAAEPSLSRNAVFELEVGAGFLAAGIPASSEEPDIVLEEDGRWNVAVKSLYSTNSATLMDRISEGARQALDRPCSYALVVIGVSNRVPHERFLPLIDARADTWGSFPDSASADAALRREVAAIDRTVHKEARIRMFKAAEDPRFRGVLAVAHTVCGIGGVPGFLSHVSLLDRADLFPPGGIQGPEHRLGRIFAKAIQ